jgi:WD40 repeat protein
MSDVFISYARRNLAFAEPLHAALAAQGLDVWRDAEDIPYGTEWWNRICAAIESADGVLFVLTPEWAASPTCRKELDHAVRHHKRLIPVAAAALDGCEVPAALSTLNYVQFPPDDHSEGVRRVVEVLRTDHEWAQFHTWLLGRAREWEDAGHDRSRLLGGATLAATEQRLALGAARTPVPTELQAGYVLASRQAETSRRRRLLSVLTVFLALMTVATAVALAQRGAARRNEAQALANEQIARGVAAAGLARRPGSELEALVLAVQAAGPSLRRGETPAPEVVAGLSAAVAAARHSLPLRGHTARVTSAAFSPDASRVLTGSDDRTVRLWDAADGRLLATVRSDAVNHLGTWFATGAAFSRDGARVVVPTRRNARQAVVLDARTGRQVEALTVPGPAGTLTQAAFAPDGTPLATVANVSGSRGTVQVRDARSGKVLREFAGRGWAFVALSPDGARAVTGGQEQVLRFWDARADTLIPVVRGRRGWFKAGVFSPDGTRFVAALEYGARALFTRDGEYLASLQGHPPLTSSVFSPGGEQVVDTRGPGHTPRLLDARTGEPARMTYTLAFDAQAGHLGDVNTAAFSPDGALVVTAGQDGTVRLWDPHWGHLLRVLEGHASRVGFAAFSPDPARPRVVTGSADNTARVWDVLNDRSLATLRGHAGAVAAAAFSPDGARLLTAGADSTARLWDARTGAPLATLRGHAGGIVAAGFSPDGAHVLTAGADGTARLWSARTGGLEEVVAGQFAAFSADGGRMWASGGPCGEGEGAVKRWKTPLGRGGRPAGAAGGHVARVDANRVEVCDVDAGSARWIEDWEDWTQLRAAAVSADGARMVAVGQDVRLFDGRTGARLGVFHGHAGEAAFAVFAPDGSRFVTGGGDDRRLWVRAAGTGALTAVLEGHATGVRSAVFSPDGALVLTAGADSTARLWDAPTGSLLAVLEGHAAEVNAAAFSPDGRRVVTVSNDAMAKVYAVALAELASESFHAACALLRHQPEGARVRQHCGSAVPPERGR